MTGKAKPTLKFVCAGEGDLNECDGCEFKAIGEDVEPENHPVWCPYGNWHENNATGEREHNPIRCHWALIKKTGFEADTKGR